MGAMLLNHSQITETQLSAYNNSFEYWLKWENYSNMESVSGLIVIPNWIFNIKSHMDLDNLKLQEKQNMY